MSFWGSLEQELELFSYSFSFWVVAATLRAQILLPFPCIFYRNASEAYGGAGIIANGRYTTDLFDEPILNEGDVSVPIGSVHFFTWKQLFSVFEGVIRVFYLFYALMDVSTFYWNYIYLPTRHIAYVYVVERPFCASKQSFFVAFSASLFMRRASSGSLRPNPLPTWVKEEPISFMLITLASQPVLPTLSGCISRRELPNEALLFITVRTMGWENCYLWRRITLCEGYNYAAWLYTIRLLFEQLLWVSTLWSKEYKVILYVHERRVNKGRL